MVAPILGRESNSQTTTIFQRSCRKPTQQEAKHNSCSRTGLWLPCEAETSGRFVSVRRHGSAGLPGFCQLPAFYSIYIAFCKPCLREEGACPHGQGAAVLRHLRLWAESCLDRPKYPEVDQPLSRPSVGWHQSVAQRPESWPACVLALAERGAWLKLHPMGTGPSFFVVRSFLPGETDASHPEKQHSFSVIRESLIPVSHKVT